MHPDKETLRALHSNASLAYAKAGRFHDALASADAAIELAPGWQKGHWRRGTALLGLRDVPGAVAAFLAAWRLAPDDTECLKKLEATIQRLTREQLGAAILELFTALETDGTLRRAEVEATGAVAMQEAAFCMVADSHKRQKGPGPYFASLLRWLTQGIDPGEAYVVRSAVHRRARCYLQARADADAAVTQLKIKVQNIAVAPRDKGPEAPPTAPAAITLATEDQVTALLAVAYQRLGEACLAERDHPDRDAAAAFKALTRATQHDPLSQEMRDLLQEATEELTKEQVERAALEVHNESSGGGVSGGGVGVGALRPGERRFRVEALLVFPSGRPAQLLSGVREAIRGALAAGAGVDAAAVSLEGVRPARPPAIPAMEVVAHVAVGPHLLQGNALAKALTSGDAAAVAAAVGGDEVCSALGPPDAALCRAEVVDVTPRGVESGETVEEDPEGRRALAIPAPPKIDLEVPYKMYRLVTSRGTAVERVDKHPFAMSRVYYDAAEKPEEVWAELADGSCRWRQTAGELRIIALRVPSDLRPRDLGVDISPYHVRVYKKGAPEEVYLEGRLHRGVVPEDCFWTHCGGEGEDGCCIILRKMNLEVLQRRWAHSETWWPRLFEGHGDIAWDDYEKDYSDLPEEVMARHRAREAIEDAEKGVEGRERRRREALQAGDDARKRRRQDRLAVLRSGGGGTRVQAVVAA